MEKLTVPLMRNLLGNTPFILDAVVTRNGISIKHKALIDSGASGYLFMNRLLALKIARRTGAKITNTEDMAHVQGYRNDEKQPLHQVITLSLQLDGRHCSHQHFVMVDMNRDIIVGDKFFIEHKLLIDCANRRLLMREEVGPLAGPDYVPATNLLLPPTSLEPPKLDKKAMSDIERRAKEWEKAEKREQEQRNLLEQRRRSLEGKRTYSDDHRQSIHAMVFELRRQDQIREHVTHNPVRKKLFVDHNIDICEINAAAFMTNLRNPECEVFSMSIHEIDTRLNELSHIDEDDAGEELELEEIRARLPTHLQDLADVFSKIESDKLPERRSYDHQIILDKDMESTLSAAPLYKMSATELEACKEYLVENLKKGFIEASSASFASPVLFVKKPNGSLRLCIDYRKLNAITKKDRYPLPLLDEVLSRMTKAVIFTKLDIRAAFNRIRMAEEAEELTSFRTRYGQFKCKVLPFGLCNGPATFQRYMNDVLFEYLDSFCTAYLDDIIIFSESQAEHDIHVRQILEKLRSAGLQVDLKKCEFGVKRTKFLGYILTIDGIEVDPDKIEVIRDWKYAKTVREIQSYLGFCNFYRRFIKDYGKICAPLNHLTNKGVVFNFDTKCQEAWDTLRTALMAAPVLHHFNTDYETMMETDASDGVVSGVLSQKQRDDLWHPVAYFTKTLKPAENNYPIHDKELLAIIRAFEEWRAELEGAAHPTLVYSDHQALEYFMTTKKLSGRQARWAELLTRYHFMIKYRPGKENALADILSRRNNDIAVGKEIREESRKQVMIPEAKTDPVIIMKRKERLEEENGALPAKLMEMWTSYMVAEGRGEQETPAEMPAVYSIRSSTFSNKYLRVEEMQTTTTQTTPQYFSIIDKIVENNRNAPGIQGLRDQVSVDGDFSIKDGLLFVKNRLFVPEGETDGVPFRTALIKEIHAQPSACHPGVRKMTQILEPKFWWPKMKLHIQQYVTNCHDCRRAKIPRDKTPGLLHPLSVPDHVWQHTVMDFKYMPMDEDGYDAILVFVDRLGKRPISIPCKRTCTARELAQLFLVHIYRHYGPPESMVSDRGPQFVSEFWNEVCHILQVKMKLSTAHSHQTAGQVEVMNQYIDQRLRPFVTFYQKNWSKLLPMVDFAAAALPNEATGQSSFKTEMNYEPRWSFDYAEIDNRVKTSATQKFNMAEAREMMKGLEEARDKARALLQKTNERYEKQANLHRREPDFDVGNFVWLATSDLKTDRPSKKLSAQMAGPFEILEKDENGNYLLNLPATVKVHPWFHARKLRLDPQNPLPGQHNEAPPLETVNGEEEFEVEEILGCRLVGRKLKYRVKWVGYDVDLDEYEPWTLANSPVLLRDFHAAHPELPGPPKYLFYWLECAENDTFPEDKIGQNAPVSQAQKRVAFHGVVEEIDLPNWEDSATKSTCI